MSAYSSISMRGFLSFLRRPLTVLSASGLLLLATTRLAFALVISGCLLAVFSLSTLLFNAAKRLLPNAGKRVIAILLASFTSSLYLLAVTLLNPLLGSSLPLLVLLTAVLFVDTKVCERTLAMPVQAALLRAASEAGRLSVLLLAASLIREPLGQGSLSLPGGLYGITVFTFLPEAFPARTLSIAAGGLGLLSLLALFMGPVFREKLRKKGRLPKPVASAKAEKPPKLRKPANPENEAKAEKPEKPAPEKPVEAPKVSLPKLPKLPKKALLKKAAKPDVGGKK